MNTKQVDKNTETPQKEEKTETVEELLNRLRNQYLELDGQEQSAKDQLIQIQDRVLTLSQTKHKAFVTFTQANNQHMANIIKAQQQQLKTSSTPAPAPARKPNIAPAKEETKADVAKDNEKETNKE